MKKVLILLSALVLFGCTAKETKSPVLTIEGGQVQGVQADVKDVFVFRGIPYAAPPINENRWKAPQPVQPWDGVYLAYHFGNPSYQHIQFKGGYYTEWGYGDEAPFSEDCLYANVWTKKPGDTNAKLPVALWIHGGGYREGFSSEPEFDAQEWAGKDVVIVSINYRLGVFGFMAHPLLSEESPNGVSGNYGILDMIQGLKWIKNNIAQFGGDPENVMIFGQSAGGGAVRTLCESPLARGLFNKAIIMSAGGLTVPGAAGMGSRRGGMSGFPGFGGAGQAEPKLAPYKAPAMPDGLNALQRAEFNSKVVLDWGGYNTLEKMRRAETETIHAIGTIYSSVPGNRESLGGSPIVDGYVSLESFDAAALDGTLADVPYMIGYTMNDMGNMAAGIEAFCIDRQEKGNKAWAYEFARLLPDDGSHPEVTVRLKGAFHSSDLWYVFKSLQHGWRPWTKGDWDLSEKMLTAWTNFAKYGDPNGPDGGEWTPCTKENNNFMIFKLDKDDNEASGMGQPITELGY